MSSSIYDLSNNFGFTRECNHPHPPTHVDQPMHRILGSAGKKGALFLGNIDAAEDPELLSNHSIGAVLSVIDAPVNVDSSVKTLVSAC